MAQNTTQIAAVTGDATDEEKKPMGLWQWAKNAVANWFINLVNGPKFLRRRAIIKLVSETAEGRRLLKIAKDNGVPIRVTRFKKDEEISGSVDHQWGDATIGVKVANNGDNIDMATTLHHELRHVEQQRVQGTIEKGFFGSLHDATRQHIISLLEEADAFTAEITEALRRERAGQPEFMATMRLNGRKVMAHVEKFLSAHPYESFENEGAFNRALFTHIMQGGLDHYSTGYFKDYAATFEKATTAYDFRMMMDKDPEPPKDAPANTLFGLYGGSFGGETSLGGLAKAFAQAQPKEVLETLRLIEFAAEKADVLSAKNYLKLRERIIKRSKSLSEAFNKKSLDDRPKTISGEELYARLQKKQAAVISARAGT